MSAPEPVVTRSTELLKCLGVQLPILQAPMAGVSTPALAATVSNAGALGALGLGAADPQTARRTIEETQRQTAKPFNVNFFCHGAPQTLPEIEANWIERAAPIFARFGQAPPKTLRNIYPSFRDSDALLKLVLDLRPQVVSFHFGLPRRSQILAMRQAGCVLLASATSLDEARMIEAAGFHAIIAQGWEAGGHRGIYEPGKCDCRLPLFDLLDRLLGQVELPVIAAGGLMDGYDITRAMAHGAAAAQLGTAFIPCPESAADQAYRDKLTCGDTVMTSAISGRPARCLQNDFTSWARDVDPRAIPDYPRAYDLGKAMNAAASHAGETGFGAQWAGTGAGHARVLPAADLIEMMQKELHEAQLL